MTARRESAPPVDAPRTIVFLAVNASYAHSSLAAWYLQEIAERAGWQWTTVEMLARDEPWDALDRIGAVRPRVLASTFYLFNRQAVLSVLRRYKALRPECVVIGGGPEFLGDNRAFLESERAVDAVVRGEGEMALEAFLRTVDSPAEWPRIPGICGRMGRECFDGGFAGEAQNLDDIPSPYRGRGTDFGKPFVQFETSRGCSNRCSFCTSGRGGTVRVLSMARVRSDLHAIRAMGVRGVRIVDRTFNERPSRCIELVRLFRDEYPELRFHLEIDPARLTRSILAELAAAPAGRFHIEAGIQSLSPTVCRNVGRQATVRRSLAGLAALCRLNSVEVHADLIAGLPGASLADLFRDTDELVKLKPGEIQLETLKLLPGTVLDRERPAWGIVASPEAPYDVLLTPDMTGADLAVARDLSRLLDRYYNAPALKKAVCLAAEETPDFWRRFTAFLAEQGGGGTCPDLEARFRLLDEFLSVIDSAPAARNRLRYDWMKWGLSTRRGICPVAAWKDAMPAGAQLVEGDGEAHFSRWYAVDLDRRYLFGYGGAGGSRKATAVFTLGPAPSAPCRPSPSGRG